MGRLIEDLYDHEGYGARRLPDGTLTGAWTPETRKFDAYVAACGCGWHGGDHPPTESGYEAALEQWESDHALPLLAHTVPDHVREAISDATRMIAKLVAERPQAALRVLDELGAWSSRMHERLNPVVEDPALAADRMRQRLTELGQQEHGRTLRR